MLREAALDSLGTPRSSWRNRSKEQLEEWEMTLSVSVGLSSKAWNSSHVQPVVQLPHLHANSILQNAPSNFPLNTSAVISLYEVKLPRVLLVM